MFTFKLFYRNRHKCPISSMLVSSNDPVGARIHWRRSLNGKSNIIVLRFLQHSIALSDVFKSFHENHCEQKEEKAHASVSILWCRSFRHVLHFGFGSPIKRNEKENGSPVIINISVSGRDWNNGHLPPLTDGPTIWTCPTDSTLPNAFDAMLTREIR